MYQICWLVYFIDIHNLLFYMFSKIILLWVSYYVFYLLTWSISMGTPLKMAEGT